MLRRTISGIIFASIIVVLFSSLTEASLEHASSVSDQTTTLLSDYGNVTTHEGDRSIDIVDITMVEIDFRKTV